MPDPELFRDSRQLFVVVPGLAVLGDDRPHKRNVDRGESKEVRTFYPKVAIDLPHRACCTRVRVDVVPEHEPVTQRGLRS